MKQIDDILKEENIIVIKRRRRKTNGHRRNREDDRRYKKIYDNTSRFFPSVYIKDKINGDQYWKRVYRGKRSKYLKKISNRKLRRYHGEIGGKCGYKRIFDYWWELY